MEQQPLLAHHSRTRHDAGLPNGIHDDRDRPRSHHHRLDHDLGMTTLRRSVSPAAPAALDVVNRPSDLPTRERERERDRDRDRGREGHHSQKPRRGRSAEPPEPDIHHRRYPRERTPPRHERSSRPSHRSPHGRRDRSRERAPNRVRDQSPQDPRHLAPGSGSAAAKSREDLFPDRVHPSTSSHSQRRASPSSLANKRPRSPSPLRGGPESKKSRRDRSPARPSKAAAKSSHPRGSNRPPSPSYRHRSCSRSPAGRRDRRSKPKKRPRTKSPGPSSRRRSRSPHPPAADYLRAEGGARRRSPSPGPRDWPALPGRRNRSRSRPGSPAQWDSRQPVSSDTPSHRPPTRDQDSHPRRSPGPPPGSPRDRRRPRSSRKKRGREERRKSFDPASGANSIEVNMGARGGFRGGFNPPVQPAYAGNRSYSQSSGHGTPNSSYHGSHHGSPPGQSPYGGSGRGWNSQQFSPQGQYTPPYPHGNYGPPTAPQSHFHPNQGHHSPTYPPSGPSSQYPTGPYRGGRGSNSFRGGSFGPGRGVHRGGFKSTQWNANPQTTSGRNSSASGEEAEPHAGPKDPSPKSTTAQPPASEDLPMADSSENPFRPSKDLQVEDTGNLDKKTEEEMPPPPSRPTPTGPQSQTPNKFSFSMKNASKPVVAAPRPEISSKFNAAPPPRPREPQQKPAQKPVQQPVPERPAAPRSDRDPRGGLPKNVPTEPASARAARPPDRRQNDHNRPVESAPRTRKVKKIMKRLKERPVLPPDMATSKSVYFRKPGNESVIGSGTYGKVFKGVNVYTRNLVALKRIRMEGERDGFPVTAVREIKLLRSLSHQNIVKLQEVMVETNECFMVFEYLSHDLTGLLNHPNFTLNPSHKKHLARQLFEGLDYLHARGVLHRDIKAANILVSNDGILKLADFGLARFYAKHHQLDYTNRVITIWYRSPELLLGETQYGPAVDIWSAACVLVEIFLKRAIFPGDGSEINQLEKIHAVLGTPNKVDWPNLVEMPWFELLRPTFKRPNVFEEKYKSLLTPAAFELLAAMFQYDPDKRPSAADVLKHAYFVSEEPPAKQAVELKDIDGEWHEFESKALRRENEKKEKEARRAAQEAASAATISAAREKERKRPNDAKDTPQREPKRAHIEPDTTGSGSKRAEAQQSQGQNQEPRKDRNG
ncbi:protein kinase [Rhypophila decipiens]